VTVYPKPWGRLGLKGGGPIFNAELHEQLVSHTDHLDQDSNTILEDVGSPQENKVGNSPKNKKAKTAKRSKAVRPNDNGAGILDFLTQ
jgi:hypothetical protein